MPVQSLGYVGVRANDVDEWSSYATNLLGLQLAGKGKKCRSFRMDDHKLRFIVEESDAVGVGFYGWEVTNKNHFEELAARVDNSGRRVDRAPRELADRRFVSDLIVVTDPIGNRIEL